MANPWAGEVDLVVDGQRRAAKLTLGALAELEAELGCASLAELAGRFEQGAHSACDVMAVVVAGLRGGGWNVSAAELISADIEGGPLAAATAAAELLVRAFTMPDAAD